MEFVPGVRRVCAGTEMLATEAILKWVRARTLRAKQNQYRERFREKIGAGDLGTSWKEKLAGDLILGGKDFVEKVRKMLKGTASSRNRSEHLEKAPVDWGRIIAASVGRNLGGGQRGAPHFSKVEDG